MNVSRTRDNPSEPPFRGKSSRRYGGVDAQERQRQRRARLIAAALRVFGEQGFHASTVRDVCRQAQLTSRYFYESFEGMEALFREVYAEVNRELMQATVASLAQCPQQADAMAESALRTFLDFIKADPHRARVILVDALSAGEHMSVVADRMTRDFAHLIAGIMRQMFPHLGAWGLDAHMLANGLVGANIRVATQWAMDGCVIPVDDVLRHLLVLFHACIAHAGELEARSLALAKAAPPQSQA